MLFFLTSILSLTAIAADFIHFRRRRRRKQPVRRALVAWVAATDALPILSSLIGALSRDNGPELMYLYMWLFWAWIVTVPPRLVFYAFNFVNLRRTGYVAACAFVLFALWGTTRGRTSIRVNRVEICSDRHFSASAIPFAIPQLDNGSPEYVRHPGDLVPDGRTHVNIESVQSGLGCVNSWGRLPRPEYLLPYGDYSFNFLLRPVAGGR